MLDIIESMAGVLLFVVVILIATFLTWLAGILAASLGAALAVCAFSSAVAFLIGFAMRPRPTEASPRYRIRKARV